MIVGPLMWLMLHTMSIKIKPEVYTKNREEILEIIRELYNIYPCKYCRADAINYLDNYQNRIETQIELKEYLYNFHHYVNVKLYKKFYDKTILDKYVNVDLKTIFNVFIRNCEINPNIELTDKLLTFFNNNQDWFY